MDDFLLGGIGAASLLIGLFFLRFWRDTRDRFFLLFALSFWVEGLHRIVVSRYLGPDEDSPVSYLVRVVAYGLIIAAIVQKNRRSR